MFEAVLGVEVEPGVLLLQRAGSAARAEACAAAARLDAIGEFIELRLVEDGGARDDWWLDATDAATLEVAAALGINRQLAAAQVGYAHALRHHLPKLGAVFLAGDIDETAFRAAAFRTGLILDADLRAKVDAELAVRLPRWGILNRPQLNGRIDRVIARLDADAVRRRRDRVADRGVVVAAIDNGLCELDATLYAIDAIAVSERLTALAATVCEQDPRTLAQRRADAFGALAVGADRLSCQCGRPACPAGGTTASPVTVHVIAERGPDGTLGPGMLAGYEGLIPAEVVAELAANARLRPLIHPRDAAPEPGYTPSAGLAAFVRARDLTCRFPHCDAPATGCDIDHTIPYGAGGATCASNTKCVCRFHHLAKTFWGWGDEQLADGTVIWTSPAGQRYVTHPGSALIFPALCEPTAPCPANPTTTPAAAGRTAKMPRRARTRAQQRAADITAERAANHHHHTTPPPPRWRPDEDFTYDETFTQDQQPIPPPF